MVTIRNIQEFYNKTLFSKPDHNGESIYFLDKNLEKPYTGILVETAKNGNIIWWSEIVDGYQNGIEKNFNLNGQLEQISEYRNNMMLGVSKEYDQSNNLIYAAIVWNNGPVKTIDLDSNMQIINKKEDERWLRNFPIPDDFKKLLNLTDQELINYQFHYTLWKE